MREVHALDSASMAPSRRRRWGVIVVNNYLSICHIHIIFPSDDRRYLRSRPFPRRPLKSPHHHSLAISVNTANFGLIGSFEISCLVKLRKSEADLTHGIAELSTYPVSILLTVVHRVYDRNYLARQVENQWFRNQMPFNVQNEQYLATL